MLIPKGDLLTGLGDIETLLEALPGTPASRGEAFELVAEFAIWLAPGWGSQVVTVDRYCDWPGSHGHPDVGIDRVVTLADGQVLAVQAKGIAADRTVSKREVDSFLSASASGRFTRRLLITSGSGVSGNAQHALDIQQVPVAVYDRSWLTALDLDWPRNLVSLARAVARFRGDPVAATRTRDRSRRPLRPHQRAAVRDVTRALRDNDRATLLMACGTGKTITTQAVAMALTSRRTLVLVPSLALVQQTTLEWQRQAPTGVRFAAVCSDETVLSRGEDIIRVEPTTLPAPVLSDAESIAQLLIADATTVIVSTYHSSPLVASAQRDPQVPDFDLVIADEAHYLTNLRPGSAFATVLDDQRIRAAKRVFTTATPRLYRLATEREPDRIYSMDEPAFGPWAHTLPFGRAIEQKLLSDYRVLVLGIDDRVLYRRMKLALRDGTGSPEVRSDVAQVALRRLIDDYDVHRIISFHSRVRLAREFARDARVALEGRGFAAAAVDGSMPTVQRTRLLRQLADAGATTQAPEGMLIANAKCLTAGVDVANLDAVLFVDPRRSRIDLVQAVGRAMRKAEDKTVGYVVVPVLLNDKGDVDPSAFEDLVDVLNALREHDEMLADEISLLARRHYSRQGAEAGQLTRIEFACPELPDADTLFRGLRLRVLERLSTTSTAV